jgi:hypothetical protein
MKRICFALRQRTNDGSSFVDKFLTGGFSEMVDRYSCRIRSSDILEYEHSNAKRTVRCVPSRFGLVRPLNDSRIWLRRHCATSRKVAGSSPYEAQSFQQHYDPGFN